MQITPETVAVGMPATLCYVNDRYAGTITAATATGKTITFTGDDGMVRTARWKNARGRRPAFRTSGAYGETVSVGTARNYQAPEV